MQLEHEPLPTGGSVTYAVIPHLNSNRSRRRGLPLGHLAHQFVRSHDGVEAPYLPTKKILRALGASKYWPHIGKKQQAKAAVRNHVSA